RGPLLPAADDRAIRGSTIDRADIAGDWYRTRTRFGRGEQRKRQHPNRKGHHGRANHGIAPARVSRRTGPRGQAGHGSSVVNGWAAGSVAMLWPRSIPDRTETLLGFAAK